MQATQTNTSSFALLRKVFGATSIGAWAVISSLGSGAHAQQPPQPGEPEEGIRESFQERERILEDRSTPAERRARATTIPFERVLDSPENTELNLAYAREQIAAGDLKEAAATLERILLLQSDLHDVRVLYGLVLYRLGILDRSRYELERALEADGLSPTIRAEAEVYLDRIRRDSRRTRGSLTLTTGFDWDENRNQATTSGSQLFMDIPLPAPERVADFAHILTAQGRLVHDLGDQAGNTLHADLIYFRSDKTEVDGLDLDAVSAALGGTWNFGRLSVTPRFRFGQYWLNSDPYLTTIGGDIDVVMRWKPNFRTYINLRGEDEDFRLIDGFAAAALRSGLRLTTRVGAEWRYTPRQSLRVEGLYVDKDGQTSFETYGRTGVFAQHSALYARGAFTLIGFWAENSDYAGPDGFISPSTERNEWLYRGRVTAGAPLSFFLRNVDLPKEVANLNIIAQYEYETVDSNVLNFDYDTHKVSLLFSKRFNF